MPLKVYGHTPVATITDKGMVNYATGRIVPVRFTNHVDGTQTDGPLSVDFALDTGRYFASSGKSFAQISRDAMCAHRTQFPDLGPMLPGGAVARYHRFSSRVGGASPEQDLYDGIDIGLIGLADLVPPNERARVRPGLRRLQTSVRTIEVRFNPGHPEAIAPLLADGLAATRRQIAFVATAPLDAQGRDDLLFELSVKAGQFEDALALALGLSVTAMIVPLENRPEPLADMGWDSPMGNQPPTLVRGQAFRLNVVLASQIDAPVTVQSLTPAGAAGSDWVNGPLLLPRSPLAPGQRVTVSALTTVPASAPITHLPYRPGKGAVHAISAPADWGRSFGAPPLSIIARFQYGDVCFDRQVVVTAMQPSISRGPFPVPAIVVPPLSVSLSGERQIVPMTGGVFSYRVDLRNDAWERRTGEVTLDAPPGWTRPAPQSFDLAPGRTGQLHFTLSTAGPLPSGRYAISATAHSNGQSISDGHEMVGYDGIPAYPLYRPAKAMLSAVDILVPEKLSVAYVAGTGDDMPSFLGALGIGVDILSPDHIARGDLAGYDALLLGVGAYKHRPELARATSRFQDYVRAGGVVLVQGPAGGDWTDLFPATIQPGDKGTQVTEEDAPVAFLAPDAPLLNCPNAIGPADFNGWVDQRGDDFPRGWSPEIHALLSTHDQDQDAQKGGLLDLPYGKGHFIYTALAFHRQLAAGVPGAARLLVNLLSPAAMRAFTLRYPSRDRLPRLCRGPA